MGKVFAKMSIEPSNKKIYDQFLYEYPEFYNNKNIPSNISYDLKLALNQRLNRLEK